MKVLFISIKGAGVGGIWEVNKMLAESLSKRGHDVEFLIIRSHDTTKQVIDKSVKVNVINGNKKWEVPHLYEFKKILSKKKYNEIFNYVCTFVVEQTKLRIDFIKTTKEIKKSNPDIIITSHYQILDLIPEEFLGKVINVQHSSFLHAKKENANIKTLEKYNNKIINAWLCENTKKSAEKHGLGNNTFVYNPIKFNTRKRANVVNNKKLVTLSRLSSDQKRIDLMVQVCDKVLKKNKDWTLELYGSGQPDSKTMKIIEKNKQIKLMGITNNACDVLLSSSIYLSTSPYEGFSLSILEANECGVPVVSFDFGESCSEQIPDNCGEIVEFGDLKGFEKALNELIKDEKKLEEYSKNSKKFVKQFNIEKVTDEWEKLFKEVSKNGKN